MKDKSKEEKLSMTRSLKYKEVQEDIDRDDNQKTKEIIIRKRKQEFTSEIKPINESMKESDVFEDVMSKKERKKYKEAHDDIAVTKVDLKKLEKKAARNEKKKEKAKNEEEDLYITMSLKPIRSSRKVSRILKPILKLFVFLGLLFCVSYFLIYPVVLRYFITPKDVFSKVIDNITDYVSLKIDNVESDVNSFDLSLFVNSKTHDKFNGYTYNFGYGFESNNTLLNLNYNKGDTKYGFNLYQIGSQEYINYNDNILYDANQIKLNEENDIYDYYGDIRDGLDKFVSKEDTLYLISKSNEFLKSILNDDVLEKSNDVVRINGSDVKVTKHTLKIDGKFASEIKKSFVEFVLNDQKSLEILADVYGISTLEYRVKLNSVLFDVDEDFKLVFNIYMRNGNEFIGFDVSYDGFRTIYYYNYNDNLEMYLNASDYLSDDIKSNLKNFVVLIKGTKQDNKYSLVLNYNGVDRADLVVRENSETRFVVDFAMINSNNTGSLFFSDDNGVDLSMTSTKCNFQLSVRHGKTNISIVDYEINDSLKDFNKVSQDFNKDFNKNGFIYTLSEFVEEICS